MRRCSGARQQAAIGPEQCLAVDIFLQQALAQHQAEILAGAPPGRVGGFVNDVAEVVEAGPGIGGLPAATHCSRLCPPFQARVVKPSTSTFTAQRSSVRARISPHIAATVIGRPRIEPELSISSVTTVSRKSVSRSAFIGQRQQRIDDDAGQPGGIQDAFFQVELPGAGLLRQQAALQPVGELGDDGVQMLQLLVELLAQPAQFLRVA